MDFFGGEEPHSELAASLGLGSGAVTGGLVSGAPPSIPTTSTTTTISGEVEERPRKLRKLNDGERGLGVGSGKGVSTNTDSSSHGSEGSANGSSIHMVARSRIQAPSPGSVSSLALSSPSASPQSTTKAGTPRSLTHALNSSSAFATTVSAPTTGGGSGSGVLSHPTTSTTTTAATATATATAAPVASLGGMVTSPPPIIPVVAPASPPTMMALRLLPKYQSMSEILEGCDFNPRLCLSLKPSKSVTSLVKHLNKKWTVRSGGTAERLVTGQLRLYAKSLGPNHLGWGAADPKVTVGEIFRLIGKPDTFQLTYAWGVETESTVVDTPTSSSKHGTATSTRQKDSHSSSTTQLSNSRGHKSRKSAEVRSNPLPPLFAECQKIVKAIPASKKRRRSDSASRSINYTNTQQQQQQQQQKQQQQQVSYTTEPSEYGSEGTMPTTPTMDTSGALAVHATSPISVSHPTDYTAPPPLLRGPPAPSGQSVTPTPSVPKATISSSHVSFGALTAIMTGNTDVSTVLGTSGMTHTSTTSTVRPVQVLLPTESNSVQSRSQFFADASLDILDPASNQDGGVYTPKMDLFSAVKPSRSNLTFRQLYSPSVSSALTSPTGGGAGGGGGSGSGGGGGGFPLVTSETLLL